MQRHSLLDGDDFTGIGGRGGRGGGGGGGNIDTAKMIKIGVAVVLFLIAGGLLAWNAGLLGGGERMVERRSPEQKREADDRMEAEKEELERLQREGKAVVGGA